MARSEPEKESPPVEPFGYCLNTSTIRGQKLTLAEEIDLAARVGFQGIEPWISEIDAHVQAGGSLEDLAKQLGDRGLVVPSVIGFAQWVVDDEAARAKGLDEARRTMDLIRRMGGLRLAAPPAGAKEVRIDLDRVAERYAKLLELGDECGVVPQLEVWGFSATLSRLSEALYVAAQAGHPGACILADVYHLHKGGSDVAGLRLVSGAAMHVMHLNDYPANPPRETITDADRVHPGDGVASLVEILGHLYEGGFRGMLSVELFNREYWGQDAFDVARTALEKSRLAVRRAFQGGEG
jgi:sugar phosphate isomerase/epimerase